MDNKEFSDAQQVAKDCAKRISTFKSLINYSEDADEREKIDKMQVVSTARSIEFDLLQNIECKSHWGKHELSELIKAIIHNQVIDKRIDIECFWKIMKQIENKERLIYE